jgi:hypothetical protein
MSTKTKRPLTRAASPSAWNVTGQGDGSMSYAHEPVEPNDGGPAWVACECGDFVCSEHSSTRRVLHAHDCHCPPIEEWGRIGLDPYRDPYPGDEAFL